MTATTFKLWRVAGELRQHIPPPKNRTFGTSDEGRKKSDRRTVIVCANSFAEAHDYAHTALQHNWSAHTVGSSLLSITPLMGNDGEQLEVIVVQGEAPIDEPPEPVTDEPEAEPEDARGEPPEAQS